MASMNVPKIKGEGTMNWPTAAVITAIVIAITAIATAFISRPKK